MLTIEQIEAIVAGKTTKAKMHEVAATALQALRERDEAQERGDKFRDRCRMLEQQAEAQARLYREATQEAPDGS